MAQSGPTRSPPHHPPVTLHGLVTPERAHRLLAAAHHNHAVELQLAQASSDDAVDCYKLAVQARATATQCGSENRGNDGGNHDRVAAETAATVRELLSQFEAIVRKTRRLEEEGRDVGANVSEDGNIRSLDMYLQGGCRANGVDCLLSRDAHVFLPPVKVPAKIEITPCYGLHGTDQENTLESAIMLHGLALCHLESNGNPSLVVKAQELFSLAMEVIPVTKGALLKEEEVSGAPSPNAAKNVNDTEAATTSAPDRSEYATHIRTCILAADIQYSLGQARYIAGNWNTAAEALNKSLKVRMRAAHAHHHAVTRHSNGVLTEEDERLKTSLESDTANTVSLLGRIHFVSGDTWTSLQRLREVLRIRTNLFGARSLSILATKYSIGILIYSLAAEEAESSGGMPPNAPLDDAEERIAALAHHPALASILRLAPHRAQALLALGDILRDKGEIAPAVKVLWDAIKVSEKHRLMAGASPQLPDVEPYLRLAELQQNAGDHREALKVLGTARAVHKQMAPLRLAAAGLPVHYDPFREAHLAVLQWQRDERLAAILASLVHSHRALGDHRASLEVHALLLRVNRGLYGPHSLSVDVGDDDIHGDAVEEAQTSFQVAMLAMGGNIGFVLGGHGSTARAFRFLGVCLYPHAAGA